MEFEGIGKNRGREKSLVGGLFFDSKRRGFSLVEVLITIAIMIVMTAVLLSKQNVNKPQTDVANATRQLASQLRLLQNESLSGKLIGSTTICAFKFDIKKNALDYSMSYYHNDFNLCDTSGSIVGGLKTFKISSKDNVEVDSNDVSFYFKAPSGVVVSGPVSVVLRSKTDTSIKAGVCVCTSGSIVETKDASPCTACL